MTLFTDDDGQDHHIHFFFLNFYIELIQVEYRKYSRNYWNIEGSIKFLYILGNIPFGLEPPASHQGTNRPFGYCEVVDTPFHIQGHEMHHMADLENILFKRKLYNLWK